MARDLLIAARDRGLEPYGVSFHVGSQQRDLGQWDAAVGRTAMLFTELSERGINLQMVNVGGGFPARYTTDAPETEDHAEAIMAALTENFGNHLPEVGVDPGRSLVGDARTGGQRGG